MIDGYRKPTCSTSDISTLCIILLVLRSQFIDSHVLRSLFIDFNSYFASVEQQLNPALRGKPIAVVPVMADTTCAIAASYEAKRFGVKTGTIIADAKRMCPGLILVQADHVSYIEFHHRLVEVVESVIHVKKVMSIDEMSCELIGSMRNEARAIEIAHEVKRTISDRIGTEMKCSIGIAPNDFLAKTATDMQKPDGLVVIHQADLPDVLYSLELQDLCGIGKNMYKRLWKHGVYTVEMLCTAPKQKLRDVWGGIEGERMWQRLRGEELAPMVTTKSTVGHSHVLEPDLRSWEGACGVLHRLLQKAAMRLRSYELVTGNLYISIRYVDGSRWKADMNLTVTQDTVQLTSALSAMLENVTVNSAKPMKVSIALNKVEPRDSTPLPMFANTGPAREQLNTGLDAINRKYGKNTLYVGSAHDALNSAPLRIAFNYIPDLNLDDDT